MSENRWQAYDIETGVLTSVVASGSQPCSKRERRRANETEMQVEITVTTPRVFQKIKNLESWTCQGRARYTKVVRYVWRLSWRRRRFGAKRMEQVRGQVLHLDKAALMLEIGFWCSLLQKEN